MVLLSGNTIERSKCCTKEEKCSRIKARKGKAGGGGRVVLGFSGVRGSRVGQMPFGLKVRERKGNRR